MEKPATLKEKLSIFSCQTTGRSMQCIPGNDGAASVLSKAEFMEKVRLSNEACQRGDFQAAVPLYSDALRADPQNCILYSNRSAAFLKLGQHQAALDDAEKSCQLNPKWPKDGRMISPSMRSVKVKVADAAWTPEGTDQVKTAMLAANS